MNSTSNIKSKFVEENVDALRDPAERPRVLTHLGLGTKNVIFCKRCGAEWPTYSRAAIIFAVKHALKRMKNKGRCNAS
jgi:hypothetical protein